MILQPDRLPEAYLHPPPSVSLSTRATFIQTLLVFHLLLSSSSPPTSQSSSPVSQCLCCHPSSLFLHHPISQPLVCFAISPCFLFDIFSFCGDLSELLRYSLQIASHLVPQLLPVSFTQSLSLSFHLYSPSTQLPPLVTLDLGQPAQQMG